MGVIVFIDNSTAKQQGKSDLLKNILPNSKVFVAPTSKEGMRLALEADPEVIIIVGLNHREESFGLCRQIKQHKKLQDIPVIFVITENDTRETREKAFEAGADVFLSYPFDDIELQALIKTTMRLGTASRQPLKEQSILSETENLRQNMFRHFPQKIFIKDLNSVYLACNENYARDLGITPEEIIGKNDFHFHPEELARKYRQVDREVMDSGETKIIEEPYQFNGQYFWARTTKVPYRSSAGEIMSVLGIFEDITERKHAQDELSHYKENLEQLIAERTEALQREIDRRTETEKILAESESKYRNLVDYSTSIVLEWDPDGTLLFLNKYGFDFFGYKPGEILGQNIVGKMVESTESSGFDITEMLHLLKADPGEFNSRENENICSDGRKVWIAWSNKGIYDQNGQLQKILSVGIDRTRQHEMEKELNDYHLRLQKMVDQRTEELTFTNLKLLESESKFRATSENSLTGIYIIEDYLVQYINPAVCSMIGYEPDEVLGKEATIFVHPDDRQLVTEYISDRISGNITSVKYEFRGIKKDGEIIHVLTFGGIANIEGKNVLIGNLLDVTENKLNIEKLEKSKRLYAVISQVNLAIVHIKEEEKLYSEICKIAVEFGKFRMAWIGLVDETTRLVKPQSVAGFEDGYLSAIRQIKAGDTPEGRGPTGRCIMEGNYAVCNDYSNDPDVAIWRDEALKRNYHSAIAIPIKQNGQTIGSFTLYATSTDYFDQEEIQLLTEVADDISFALDTMELERQHRQSTIDLANSEQKFRNIFEYMPSGYILFDLIYDQNGNPVDHRLIEANAEFDKQTGLNRNEQIGRTSKELSWYWPEDVTQRYYQVAITGNPFSYERYNDSLNRYYEVRVSSPRPGQFALLFNDRTEQRKSEIALEQSEAQLKGIFNNLQDVYIQSDSAGKIAVLSPSAVQFYGYDSMDELIGMPAINQYAYREDRDALIKALQLDGKVSDFVCQAKRKDGTTFWVSINIHFKYDSDGRNIGMEGIVRDISERKQAEEEIRLSREHFQTLFNEAPLGTALIDTQTGKILEVNLKFAQITGRSKEKLLSTDWMSMTHPDDAQIGLKQLTKLKAGKISGFKCRKRFIKPDGDIIWVSITIAVIQSSGNQTLRHLAMIEDITELKANEEKVTILSRAVEQSQVTIVITDHSGDIEYVNPKFSEVSGYSREEVIGQNSKILMAGIIPQEYYNELWNTITSGKDWQGEFVNRKKSGELYHELASISPITDESGKISHFVAIKEDITERKKATEQIKTLSAVVEQSPLLILITDANYRITYANSQFTAFTQFPLEEIKGKTPWIFNPKHWDNETYNRMWDVLNAGKAWQIDSVNSKKDGTPFWEHVTVHPLRDENDTISNYIIIKEDITEKKQLLDDLIVAKEKAEESEQNLKLAQTELIRSENLLKDIQTISKTGGWEYDLETQQMFWTPELFRIHEIEPDPNVDHIKLSANCYLAEDREKILNAFNRCVEKGIGYDLEFPFITYKGNKKWIRTRTEPIFEEGKIIKVIGSLIDITDRKLAEEALVESEKRIQKKLNNLLSPESDISELSLEDIIDIDGIKSLAEDFFKVTNIPIVIIDLEGKVIVGKDVSFWKDICLKFHRVHPETLSHCLECDTILTKGIPKDKFKSYLCKNNLWDNATPIVIGGRHLGNLFTGQFFYEGEKPDDAIFREQAARYGFDEKEYMDALNRVPVYSREFINDVMSFFIKLSSMISTLSHANITLAKILEQHKRTEQALLIAKEKAEESDRLKTAFLLNVYHEIRTPMNGILGFMELLNKPGLGEKERSNFISIINKSGERLMNTINDIVEISKIEIGDIQVNFERIDLEELMQNCYNFFDIQTLEKGLKFEITNQVTGDDALFISDKVKLDGILMNLIKNAIKFTDKGKIEIGNYIKDGCLWLYVTDTGRGIPENKRAVIFNRFMQADLALTRGYEGLGLGLSIVKSYVQALKGTIEVISTEGTGTTFLVSIPCHQAKEPDDYMHEILSFDTVVTKPVVLIAGDDDVNTFFIKEVLSKEFRIIHARSGEQAVQLFYGNPDISIILMDIKMPGENKGLEAARKIREINQEIPIIVQTACEVETDRLMTGEAGCTHFIAKPFSGKNLLSLIKNILDIK